MRAPAEPKRKVTCRRLTSAALVMCMARPHSPSFSFTLLSIWFGSFSSSSDNLIYWSVDGAMSWKAANFVGAASSCLSHDATIRDDVALASSAGLWVLLVTPHLLSRLRLLLLCYPSAQPASNLPKDDRTYLDLDPTVRSVKRWSFGKGPLSWWEAITNSTKKKQDRAA